MTNIFKIKTTLQTAIIPALIVALALIIPVISSVVMADSVNWTQKASMPTARYNLGVAAAGNGKIYAIGGYAGGPSNKVEEYDPATNTWATRANLPQALVGHRAIGGANGKIYVVGGVDNANITVSSVQEYDPTTDTWTTRASMPTPRSNLGLAISQSGKIYAIGGANADGSARISTVEEYDYSSDTWTTRASMPSGRSQFGTTTATNGKIYVVGGFIQSVGLTNSLLEYDPATDTWTTRAGMSTARVNLGAASSASGKVYAIGGEPDVGSNNIVEEYNPNTDTWIPKTIMPTPRTDLGVTTATNGKIYAIGGNPTSAANEEMTVILEPTPTPTPTPTPSPTPSPVSKTFFMHKTGSNLFLDSNSPTSSTAQFSDSASVNFSGGNAWKQIGEWPADPSLTQGILTAITNYSAWLGLKNSDDTGTNFDLKTEVYKDTTQVATSVERCITGIVRNPNNAKLVNPTFDPFTPALFNGTSEVLTTKVFARIGTNPDDTKCPGHNSAAGLRFYYDSTSRPAAFTSTFLQ